MLVAKDFGGRILGLGNEAARLHPAVGAAGDHFNGIHEVAGSIPVSSTNSFNNLRER
jgi:hypothetical protein